MNAADWILAISWLCFMAAGICAILSGFREQPDPEMERLKKIYDAGYEAAGDIHAELKLPYENNDTLNGLYVDGWTDRREEMAKKQNRGAK